MFKPITKEDGMATFKGKVTAERIRYYKGGEKVLVEFDQVAEFDNENIYKYYLQSGMIVEDKPKKKTTKKKEEEKPVEDAE